MSKAIFTEKAPAPVGPYSQAVEAGGFVFCSGQIPLDAETGDTEGSDICSQTEKVCENISNLLSAAGLSFENVVKTVCYLSDMADFQKFNEVYAGYFVSEPARSCVAVRTLPKNVMVEIEVTAARG